MSINIRTFEDGPSDSKVTAIHAALLPSGKVLIFHCRSYPMWTRLYDPVENEITGETYPVPIWPVATPNRPIDPSRIFCAGHCFMADGKLLVAGGEKDFPYPFVYIPPGDQPDRGIDYSFIFDLDAAEPWYVPILEDVPQFMKKGGRWYPSLTITNDKRVLVMGGLSDNLTPLTNQRQINKVT